MWTDILIFLPMLLALAAVAALIWLRRHARKQDATEQDDPDKKAQRPIWRPK